MRSDTRPRLRRLTLLGIGLAAALVAGAVRAEESCGRLFPDRACDRRARPPGSVMPMSFPFLFEDPYITTGTNAIGLWHHFPKQSLFGNGDLALFALQVRIAVTERLAFILTKDGFASIDSEGPLVRSHSGFLDLTAGFKYAAWTWEGEDESAILTPSLRYEIPVGQSDVYQDGGSDDGVLLPALSAAYQNEGWHVVGGIGGQAGLDSDKSSSSVFYNLHVDHAFPWAPRGLRFVVPFLSVNGIHYVESGDGSRRIETRIGRLPLRTARGLLGLAPFEGADLFNLGSDHIAGAELVTMAWGLRLVVGEGLSFGASYERPLSRRKDLWDQRLTLMIGWEI